jgi:hypothetical protein
MRAVIYQCDRPLFFILYDIRHKAIIAQNGAEI